MTRFSAIQRQLGPNRDNELRPCIQRKHPRFQDAEIEALITSAVASRYGEAQVSIAGLAVKDWSETPGDDGDRIWYTVALRLMRSDIKHVIAEVVVESDIQVESEAHQIKTCPTCGGAPDGARFNCPYCGAQLPIKTDVFWKIASLQTTVVKSDGPALTALILGIVGILISPILGIPLGVVSTIFAARQLAALRGRQTGGRGLTLAGLLTGIASVLFSVLFWVAIIVVAFQRVS